MKKIILVISFFSVIVNAAVTPRFINIKDYKTLTKNEKSYYLMGSIDMLEIQLKNKYGINNNVSLCLKTIGNSGKYVTLLDNYLNSIGTKYDNYSTSEILTVAIAEYCKK
ncbi:hypothetical protein GCM10012288_14920 [Malaciobacter pacificus]|uniref:Uncharacterized protein n=1 Tax=Malaciobacter pacificus TaxID=1080223 RepID=A0A5C2H9Q1_9BACT|nr:hypothetical protein [Malaciobacter pacificus]QEP35553.1 hypothetical protein APAC_2500 [Malaciobacter pacificus]GGD41730.1 hypothetical protein GCM10012288_14920 [Malaciobacter pacificus]